MSTPPLVPQDVHVGMVRAHRDALQAEIRKAAAARQRPASEFVAILFHNEDAFVRAMVPPQLVATWKAITVVVSHRDELVGGIENYEQDGVTVYADAAARLRAPPPAGRMHVAVFALDHLSTMQIDAPDDVITAP